MAMFNDTNPGCGDTDALLWKKINQEFSEQNGNAHPPQFLDWEYQSLWKIAAILAGCP